MGRLCTTISECKQQLTALFHQLHRLEPPGAPPSPARASDCFAASRTTHAAPHVVHLRITGTYPNHPSQRCVPTPEHSTHTIDFAHVTGDVILLAGVSSIGNGDDHKWFIGESYAGFAYVSLEPLTAKTWKTAQQQCPDYSPPRAVTTVAYRHGAWSEALAHIGAITAAATTLRGASLPTNAEMHFPFVDDASRYWGVCKAGRPEVETVIVGGQATHPPSDAPNNPKQCELGPWTQVYEYENRPMVPVNTLPHETQFLCVRALESNPTPFIQGAINLAQLHRHSITLTHDALDPRHVIRSVGEKQIDTIRANSIFTVTLKETHVR